MRKFKVIEQGYFFSPCCEEKNQAIPIKAKKYEII